jgi:hypothetical protein
MNNSSILLPILMQVSLTLMMFLILGARKTSAIKSGEVDRQKTALDNNAWPEEVIKVSNNIANQFQTPIIFYVLSILFYLTNTVTLLVVVVCWVYSISRLMHAFVHIGSNFVPARFGIFLVSVVSLFVLLVLAFINLPILAV